MKYFGIGCLVIVLIFGMVGLGIIGKIIGTLNYEADLRSRIEARQKQIELSWDTMTKVIMQKTQLPAAAKADLLALLPEIVAGRTGGSLFKSISETHHELTMPLYQDISRTIESERHQLLRNQEELLDLKASHDALVSPTKISGVICRAFGKRPIEIRTISSTQAKEVIRTGVDDNVDLGLTPKSAN
jgi:hypothetical protein